LRLKLAEKTREKTREKILRLLAENPKINSVEISQAAKITIKGVEWNLKKLKDESVITRIGPDKGGCWKVIKSK